MPRANGDCRRRIEKKKNDLEGRDRPVRRIAGQLRLAVERPTVGLESRLPPRPEVGPAIARNRDAGVDEVTNAPLESKRRMWADP